MEKIKRNKTSNVYNIKDRLVTTIGIWMDGRTYWLKDESEKFFIQEGISIRAKRKSLHSKVNYFDFFVTNHGKMEKKVKLLIMHYHNNPMKEHFSFVSPADKIIYHFADQMIYLVNGRSNGSGINECTIQPQWNISSEVFWSSLEKGTLKYRPMVKGTAVSIASFTHDLNGNETQKSHCWTIFGYNKEELMQLNATILKTY